MKTKILFRSLILDFKLIILIRRKINFFEKIRGATNDAKFSMISIRHRKIKKISDGNKITEVIFI